MISLLTHDRETNEFLYNIGQKINDDSILEEIANFVEGKFYIDEKEYNSDMAEFEGIKEDYQEMESRAVDAEDKLNEMAETIDEALSKLDNIRKNLTY